MAGVRPPQTIRVPGTGPTHPLDNAIKRQLARVPQQTPARTPAHNSLKAKSVAPAPINGGGASTPGTSISTSDPMEETPGAAADPGHSGLASDAAHVHAMPSIFPVEVQVAGTPIGTRSKLNFVSGASVVDNPVDESIDITVTGGGGGGGGVLWPQGGVPALAAFTWLNQGTATAVTNGDGSITLGRTGGGTTISALYLAAPATPYTWTIGYIPHMWLVGSPNNQQLLYDSVSGKIYTFTVFGNLYPAFALANWTNATTFLSNDITTDIFTMPAIQYQRIVDDGVNRSYYWSSDGVNFELIYTNTSSHFITPDNIGIGISPVSSPNMVGMTLVYWNVV